MIIFRESDLSFPKSSDTQFCPTTPNLNYKELNVIDDSENYKHNLENYKHNFRRLNKIFTISFDELPKLNDHDLQHISAINLSLMNLSSIPELSLDKLINLKSLNLFGNEQLTYIPDLSSLVNLTRLDIFGLPLCESLPCLPASLTYLDCCNNNLQNLDLNGLTKLTYLDCSKNNLSEINGLSELTQLTYLNCSYNNLITICISHMNDLTQFICYDNNIPVLPKLPVNNKLEKVLFTQK